MRRLVLALVLTTSSATAAFAVEPPDAAGKPGVRSQFYIFDGSSFEVGARTPGIDLMNPRQAARFGRLMSLKKDLLRGLASTSRERVLR